MLLLLLSKPRAMLRMGRVRRRDDLTRLRRRRSGSLARREPDDALHARWRGRHHVGSPHCCAVEDALTVTTWRGLTGSPWPVG